MRSRIATWRHHRLYAGCLWLCALALLAIYVTSGRADAADKEDVRKHVTSLIESYPYDEIRKWHGEIRYYVYGYISKVELRYLQNKVSYLSALAGDGANLQRTEGVNDAKLFFVFATKMEDFEDVELVRSLFRLPDEPMADYQKRLKESGSYLIGRFGWAKGRIGAAALIAEMQGLSHPERLSRIFETAFLAVIGAVARSDFRPSIVEKQPRRSIVIDRLPTLDEAFVRALYSPRVTFGMEREKASQLITDIILERLDLESTD